MNTEKSERLYRQAAELMPGGVNSPVRAFKSVGKHPVFIDRAEGSKLVDVDGNEYIDYVCSWGPNILGHSHPAVLEAVKRALNKGLTFGACHEGEIKLARLIQRHFPSMELLRLVSSGTEAVMSAIRVARGYTGKNKIVKFQGCYHGHCDALLVKAGSGLLTFSSPDSAGIPESFTEHTLLANYNDEASVQALFERYGEDIACVLVEPVAANMGVVPPKKGFLQFLRDITKKYHALLLFDEVITGFRLALGGAQEYYGITPDLTALGKIVGGGFPLAAYGGRREIMECVAPLGAVYQAGTLSGNPIAVAAGAETIMLLESAKNLYRELDRKAEQIEAALRGKDILVNRAGSILTPFFTKEKVCSYHTALSADRAQYARFFSYLLENGVYIAPSQFEAMFLSSAHSDDDIERTCSIINNFT